MYILVSTSVALVLISVALTLFYIKFECFSQDLTDIIDSVANSTTFSLYLPVLCIAVLRDQEQPAAPATAR